jgi:type IV secretory pathway VirB2 component (pilin)
MAVFRRMLPTALAIAVGIFVLAAMFTTDPLLDAIGAYLIDTAVIVAAFALFLGLLNVVQVHGRKIRERQPGRLYSFVLLAAMLIVLAVGLPPIPNSPSGPSQPIIQWIFTNIQTPIQASLYAIIVFLIITAAWRLLRTRNLEAVILLVTALLVLLGQAALGLVPILPDIRDWILDVPAMAGVRGILLGVGLGALLTGIRLLLGVERPYSD